MKIRYTIDRISATQTTEDNIFNNRDEVYLTVAGTTELILMNPESNQIERRQSQRVAIPRVSPPKPEDYYGLKKGQSATNILIKEWDLALSDNAASGQPFGHRLYIDVFVREQDNAQFNAIVNLVKDLFVEDEQVAIPDSTSSAWDTIRTSSPQLLQSFFSDGDQLIGAFRLICYTGLPAEQRLPRMASMHWSAVDPNTHLNSGIPALNVNGGYYDMALPARSTAEFSLGGARADYTVVASVDVVD
jgi:hypothetical protein